MWRYLCDLDTQCQMPISCGSSAVAVNMKIAPRLRIVSLHFTVNVSLKSARCSKTWCIIVPNLRAPIFNVAYVVRLRPIQVGASTILLKLLKSRNWDGCHLFQKLYI
jgi:hypothetical protein